MRTSKIPAQKRWNTRYFLASAAAVLAAVNSASAAVTTYTWTGGALGTGTTWDTASTYWTSGSGNVAWPNTGNEIASFNASPGGTTISVATGIVLSAGGTGTNAINFVTGGWILNNGGSGTLSGNGLYLVINTPTGTDTINVPITGGTMGLYKNGAGTLVLGGANTCGSTSLSAGTIELSTGGTLANSVTASAGTSLVVDTTSYIPTSRIGGNSCTFTSANFSVVVASGATGDTTDTFTYMGWGAGASTFTITPVSLHHANVSYTNSIANTVVASTTLTFNSAIGVAGNGYATLLSTNAPALITGPNTGSKIGIMPYAVVGQYFATYDNSLGVRALNEAGGEAVALASGVNVLVSDGPTNNSGNVGTILSLTLRNSATAANLDLSGNTLTVNPATFNEGGIAIGAGVLSAGVTGNTISDGTLAFGTKVGFFHTFADLNVSAAITGSGGLVKAESGNLTLSSASNSYTGTTYVNAGTLKLGTTNGITSGNSLTLQGGNFDLNGFNQSLGTVTFTTLNSAVTNTNLSYTPTLTFTSVSAATGNNGSFAGQMNVVFNFSAATTFNYPIFTNNGNDTFNNTGSGTYTFGAGSSFTGTGNIIINANSTGGYILNGTGPNKTGYFANSGSGNNTITVANALGSNMTGLIQNGANSTLIVSGSNTYTGDTIVNSGILNFSATAAKSVSSNARVNPGGTLALVDNLATATVRLSSVTLTQATLTDTSGISASANSVTNALTLNGGNTYTFSPFVSSGNTLIATMTFTGTTGSVSLTRDAGSTIVFNTTSANTDFGRSAVSGTIGGADVKLTVAPTLSFSGTGTRNTTQAGILPYAIVTDSLGTGFATYDTTAGSFAGGIRALSATGTAETQNTFASNVNVKVAATANDSGGNLTINSLDLDNGGGTAFTLTLSNPDTVASGGVLSVGVTGNKITGSTLAFSTKEAIIHTVGDLEIDSQLTGTGGLTKADAGTLLLNNPNSGTANTMSGPTTINGGTLKIGSANNLLDSGTVLTINGGTFDVGSLTQTVASLTNLAGGGTIAGNPYPDSNATGGVVTSAAGGTLIVNNSSNAEYDGSFTGNVNLTKSNSGALTLTNAGNTYTGATRVTGGKLTIASTGNINTSSGVSINGGEFNYNSATPITAPISFGANGGTLSGTGTISTPVTGNGLAIISPGNSPGIQAYTAGLAFLSGDTYKWEHNAGDAEGTAGAAVNGFDQIVINGGTGLSINPAAILSLNFANTTTFSGAFWSTTESWIIASYTSGTVTSGTFADGNIFVNGSSANLINNSNVIANEGSFSTSLDGSNDLLLNWTPGVVAVPEPASLALLGLGVAGLLARRRRR